MNKVFKISLISALAGFLFGFDTVVISGADKQLQILWGTTDLFHGTFVMSMALWGTVLGAIFASYPCDYFGRKNTLIGIGILFFVSALGSGLALDPYSFSFFRFIGGIGVGVSTIAAPTYVSEIAPANKRGQLVALYQFNIVFGILIAFVSNFIFKDFGTQPWRWMVGIEALPAALYLIGIISVPKSPRWVLFRKNDIEQAQAIFNEINGKELTDSEIKEIKSEQEPSKQKPLFSKTYRFPILLAFLIAFFNQLSGINAFLYYAPRIFEAAGLEESSALLSSIGIGVTNLIFTLLGLYLIDKIGRRLLMIVGSIGYIISLTLVSIAFLKGWQGISIPIFLFLFIASHAIGQGAVIWVFISEIFPDNLRAQGQSFGSSVHWVLAALITLFMPVALSAFPNPGYVFMLFSGMMVLQLVFVLYLMPETKGVSLERLSKTLIK
ncbi:MAG: sugar porter family MFS transporter [Flavobacteriales bacterium]|jgi:sugar porter (SP) family MFS transporter|nr:sugar porter family MFS transporter [Flavobacteriaceae bacterium]MDO7592224.1 sugar porter family MFS transporter [Flavobacteriaceae bacterium]MDO7599081.1 sugar porter family MFS transporter [Flavobacteriaceae bacterium]|tara:strand:- start:5 stop:1321 length:1317 start_codon:yes stop_codon:yes gene_type:complete